MGNDKQVAKTGTMHRELHGSTPGYWRPYLHLHPAKTHTRSDGYGFLAGTTSSDPYPHPCRVSLPVLSTYVQHMSVNADMTQTYVDGTRRRSGGTGKLAGMHWVFTHGVRHVENSVVVIGDGVSGVCASAGANDKDGGVNDGEGDADGGVGIMDGGVGVKAGGGVSAGRMKIGVGDVTCMMLLLLLGVESSM
ncbi:hypothetical protein C8R48DRAFT_671262 [Suillus tomentosus]|nr:hypothetical protein C8R48DRAFT_671262 [Suillus tomentosus]